MSHKKVWHALQLLIVSGALFCLIPVHAAGPGNELIEASAAGNVDKVKELISGGTNVNFSKDDGVTALMAACVAGHPAVVKVLLSEKADPNARDAQGATALLWAVLGAKKEIVQLLMENGADTGVRDRAGRTAFSLASRMGYAEIIELIHSHAKKGGHAAGESKPKKAQSLNGRFLEAAATGEVALVDKLLNDGADIEARDGESRGTALIWAAFHGHREVVKLLIKRGADVNAASAGGLTPLLLACVQGHISAVKLLLEGGANLDVKSADGLSPLEVALKKQNRELVDTLVGYAGKTMWGESTVERVNGRRNCLEVRSGPSRAHKKTGCLKPGESIKLNGFWSENNWAQIFEPVQGWVDARYIKTDQLPREKRAVLSTASSGSSRSTQSPAATVQQEDGGFASQPMEDDSAPGFLPTAPTR